MLKILQTTLKPGQIWMSMTVGPPGVENTVHVYVSYSLFDPATCRLVAPGVFAHGTVELTPYMLRIGDLPAGLTSSPASHSERPWSHFGPHLLASLP